MKITEIDLSNQVSTAAIIFLLLMIAFFLMILAFGKLERQAKVDKKKHGSNK